MLPNFLLPDQVVRQNGAGPAIEIGGKSNGVVAVTLGINRIIEQESIEVKIHGSVDGETWSEKPLAAFPMKFYCGVYTLYVDLMDSPEVKYLRAEWKVNRWGRGEPTPLFQVYMFADFAREGVLQAAS